MPFKTDESVPAQVSTQETMSFIKRVIRETTRPTWLPTVPEAFGEARTGTLKADEWRSYATIYLPIALVLCWDKSKFYGTDQLSNILPTLLDNTMSLVQVIVLACYRKTSRCRAQAIENHLKKYLTEIRHLFPDVNPSTNQHISLHLPFFLMQFGPVHSWWTFPFERLIGVLQQLSTNNKTGE